MRRIWAYILRQLVFDGISFPAFTTSSVFFHDFCRQFIPKRWQRTNHYPTILLSITSIFIVISLVYGPMYFLVPPSTTQIFLILLD
jgi:hypothetical protein